MAGHYNASRDPRLQSDDSDRDRIEEIARKRPRTESTAVGVEVQVMSMAPAERTPSVGTDDAVALQGRIKQLEIHISLMHKNNVELTEERAAMAKDRNYYHRRFSEMTTQHAQMVKSHAKRVEEKDKIMEMNSTILQDNAELRRENATHVEDDIEKDRRINELKEENDKLMAAREEYTLELKRLMGERDDLKKRVDALLADARKDNRDATKALFERGSSRGHGGDGQEKARSSLRGEEEDVRKRGRDDASDMKRGGGDNDMARSRHRAPEKEHDRTRDSRKQIGGDSYRPSNTRACFPSGKQPPTGPMGDRRR